MGVLGAIAGVLVTLENRNFYTTQGSGFLLIVMAAVFIGGTAISGGKGSVSRSSLSTVQQQLVDWLKLSSVANVRVKLGADLALDMDIPRKNTNRLCMCVILSN